MNHRVAAFLLAACLLPLPAVSAEVPVPESAREALHLTVYRNGFAQVSDSRLLPLRAGTTRLRLEGVPGSLHLDSVLLRPADPAAVDLLAARYEAATPTLQTLLQHAVGRTVTVARVDPATGEQMEVAAEVLSAGPDGPVYRIDGRIELDYPGRLILDSLPPNLRLQPALLLDVQSGASVDARAALHYLADGLNWTADYAIVLASARDRLDLTGYVSLSNGTDTAFEGAEVSVVAGDLNRVTPEGGERQEAADGMVAMRAMSAPAMPKRVALSDYHLYELPRPVSLAPRQTERSTLLAAEGVEGTVRYALYDDPPLFGPAATPRLDDRAVSVRLTFANGNQGPDMPLPAGVARVYMADAAGSLRLLGEDRLPATPVGAEVELRIGRSFDVTAERKQTDFARVGDRVTETAHEIVLRNARDTVVTVEVHETLQGDWRILEESQAHEQVDARTALWRVDVPAGGSRTLRYRVRTTR